jgi:histidyl-tRNA synthetase
VNGHQERYMEFKAVRGTRDFYPEQMRLRNWITDAWRRVSLRNGFEEYDSPIFEHLDLFTAKSGDEIVEQLFSLTDRGGRSLAIRPEITPALARMVNAKINSLPRPIKWFSTGRYCRAERPQKGRTREFFQWNIDVVGSDDVLADAECIFVCVDLLRELGLSSSDVKIHIGSRPLTIAALKSIGLDGDRAEKILPVLDKRPKVTDEEFHKLAAARGLDPPQTDAICRFQDCASVDEIAEFLERQDLVRKDLEDLETLLNALGRMGVGDYCRLDVRIVRGLAYYTGIVYEMFDTGKSLRAVGGGGRYDSLLKLLGGPKMGATGFGMGDVVLGILLKEKGKVPELSSSLDFFVIDGEDALRDTLLQVVGALRKRGYATDFSYTRRSLTKQLKEANKRGAKRAVIVRADGLAVKDLMSGKQADIPIEDFLADPDRYHH